jgi:threonine dehydrogenase-like Zn-dependent dehydrogenase
MTEARALWTVSPGQAELRSESLPPPSPGEVQVESWYSGISRGTERLVFHGLVPLSEQQRMRAPFQQGEFTGPVKYGYANVGRIVSPGPRHGQMVFSLFPHQDRFNIPETAAHPIPDGLPPRRAILAANMETALNAVWDAQPMLGDAISVVGVGLVGSLLCALLGRIPGVNLEAVDTNAGAGQRVAQLGARFAPPGEACADRDLVFHTSASEQGLRHALQTCRNGGKIVELSWYGSREVKLPLGADFHSRRLQLVSSQVSVVSEKKPGWTYSRRMALALDLLADQRLDALMGPTVSFDALADDFAGLLTADTLEAPAVCVSYAAAG